MAVTSVAVSRARASGQATGCVLMQSFHEELNILPEVLPTREGCKLIDVPATEIQA